MFATERRRFPRLDLPVFYRKLPLWERWRKVSDVSLGGCRIHANQPFSVGHEMKMDVLLPDGTTIHCRSRIVWTAELPEGSETRYQLGLVFQEVSKEDYGRLKRFLGELDPD